MSVLHEAGHIKNIAEYLMDSEVAWVLVPSGTQVQPQILLDPDYLPYLIQTTCQTIFPFFMTMIKLNLKFREHRKIC